MEILKTKKTSTELYKDFDKLFGAAMIEMGYQRGLNYFRRPEYYKRVTNDGLFATVCNLTSRDYTGGININMHVGVAHDKSVALLCKLTEELRVRSYKQILPTETQYGIWVLDKGRLNVNNTEQTLKTTSDVVPSANRMIYYVKTLAEPFFSKFVSLDYYLEYRKNIAVNADRDHIVPIIYYYLGRKQDAIDYIDSRLHDPKRKGYTDINDPVFLNNFYSLPEHYSETK